MAQHSPQTEIDSLRAEADLPIEELLALYARTSDDDDDDDDRGNGNEDEDEDEDPKENQGILKEALSGDVEKEGLTSELVFRNLAKQGTSAELDEDDDEGRARYLPLLHFFAGILGRAAGRDQQEQEGRWCVWADG
jgi:hypothetical protein